MNNQSNSPFFASMSDSRLLARWLGVVFAVGASLAIVWTAIPHEHRSNDRILMVMATIALLGAAALISGITDESRPQVFHIVIAAVQILITVSYLTMPSPNNDARLFYIMITPVAAFFFRPIVAASHVVFVAVVFGIAVWVQDAPLAMSARVYTMTMGALITVTALVAFAAVGTRRRDVAMHHAATHDHLTQLPNRALLAARTEEALERRRQHGGQVFMMLADLDRFKLINDTHGHHAGDELLTLLAPRLSENAPENSIVARLGGDEFAVLVEDPHGQLDPVAVAEELSAAWSEALPLQRGPIHTSGCIGVSVATDEDEPSSLLRNADAAMYRAKNTGAGVVAVYDEHQRAEVERRMVLEQALFEALADSQLSLVYQPVVSLIDGSVPAAEALLRWDHPELGVIHPGEFIPLAEEAGLINMIGMWVLDRSLGQLAEWRAAGVVDDEFVITVNISGAQLHRYFAQQLGRLLSKHAIPAGALMLELTESVLMRADTESAHVLRAIEDLGVQIALDDFGAGFSALSYLHQAKVSTVKIDQSFVGGMSTDATRHAIVDAVVALTRALGLRVVAEGVDTNEQIHLLRDMGCEFAQGFNIARPMPPEAMAEYLADRIRGIGDHASAS